MGALLVGLYLYDMEYLVWKLCCYLVHSECHLVNIKDCYFRASGGGERLVTSIDAI